MADSRKRMKVPSLDSNGCVFNDNYLYEPGTDIRSVHKKKNESPSRLTEANERLLQYVAEDTASQGISDVILMAGTYRQVQVSDHHATINEIQTPPFFNTLCELKKILSKQNQAIDFQIDGYLPSDTYGGYLAGATFDALVSGNDRFMHAPCVLDDSKLTLLYAGMHRIAALNPEADIFFDVFDGSSKTLLELRNFFAANKKLIPGNVTLRLHFYDGNHLNVAGVIAGSGAIDFNYQANLLSMVNAAGIEQIADDNHAVNVMNLLMSDGRLALFKKSRKLVGAIKTDHEEMENAQEGLFNPDIFIGVLRREIDEMGEVDARTEAFHKALAVLYTQLAADITKQVSCGVNPVKISKSDARQIACETVKFLHQFREAATLELKNACVQEFVQHYEKQTRWKNFLKALALVAITAAAMIVGAVAGYGIGMAAGAAAGMATGTTVGLAVGAALTGISAASVSGYLLFKPDDKTKAFKELVKQAKLVVT